MPRRGVWLFWVIELLTMTSQYSRADIINPSTTYYEFNQNFLLRNIKDCGITLFVSDYPSPENFTARLTFVQKNSDGSNYLGLLIKVFNSQFKNKKLISYNYIPLSHAGISTSRFSSDGRLAGGPSRDTGAVWIYAPTPALSGELIDAFQLGNSKISFMRVGSDNIRIYNIIDGVPPNIALQFLQCINNMTPPAPF